VRARVLARHARYDEAVAEAIVEAAAQRREPPCPHTLRCGGCSLQHVDPAAQISWKQQVLAEQLHHFGGLAPQQWLPPLSGPTLGYRRRARLSARFVHKRGTLMLGFRERNSHFVTEIEHCQVLDPRIDRQLPALTMLLGATRGPHHRFRQVEVSCGDDRVALVLRHLQPLGAADLEALTHHAREQQVDLYLQPGGVEQLIKLWPQDGAPWLEYALPDFELALRFHPLGFHPGQPHHQPRDGSSRRWHCCNRPAMIDCSTSSVAWATSPCRWHGGPAVSSVSRAAPRWSSAASRMRG
jgi:23S rRNA (uracil1939-C5)-methyltransferase